MRKIIFTGLFMIMVFSNVLVCNACPKRTVPVITAVPVEKELTKEEEAIDSINTHLLEMINELRAENKVGALKSDDFLVECADTRAVEATSFWSHTRPDGTDGLTLIPSNKWAGENLSFVIYDTFDYTEEECIKVAEKAFTELCNSPTHLDNMLFSKFKTIGISTYVSATKDGRIKLCSAYMFSN